jgi:hypothetical protein
MNNFWIINFTYIFLGYLCEEWENKVFQLWDTDFSEKHHYKTEK